MKVCGFCVHYAECTERYRTDHTSRLTPDCTVAEVCMSFEDKTKVVKEVVYCKDCKYYSTNNPLISNVCTRLFTVFPMQAYDFCSYGKINKRGE